MPRQDSTANVYDGLPLALTAADFDAPDAAGGTYLFERLLGWGAAMRVRLRAKRIPLEVSAPPASDGARHLFFSRGLSRSKSDRADRGDPPGRVENRADSASKAPIRRTRPAGACLSFVLNAAAVEVALEVPAKARAERGALMDLLADRISRAALMATIRALPHPFVIGRALQPARERVKVQDISTDVLLTILTESSRGSDGLWIGWNVPRPLVLAHSATFGGETEGAMLALGELFRQVAWSAPAPMATPRPKRSGRNASREARGAHGHGHLPRDADDAASPASENEANEADLGALPQTLEREAAPKTKSWSKSEATAVTRGRGLLRSSSSTRTLSRVQPRLHSTHALRLGHGQGHAHGHGHGHGASRSTTPAPSTPGLPGNAHTSDASVPFERGTEVHVLAGPFEGRIGVVQELDGKGHARVLLGILATRIPLADLERGKGPSSERPPLASSHRKARS